MQRSCDPWLRRVMELRRRQLGRQPVGLGGRVQAGDAMIATLWFAYVFIYKAAN